MANVLVQYEGDKEPTRLPLQAAWSFAGFLLGIDFSVTGGVMTRRVAPTLFVDPKEWEREFGPQVPCPCQDDVAKALHALVKALDARSSESRFAHVVKSLSTFIIDGDPEIESGWLQAFEVRSLLIACRWVRELVSSGQPELQILDTGNGYPMLAWPPGNSDVDQLLRAARDAGDRAMRIIVSLIHYP